MNPLDELEQVICIPYFHSWQSYGHAMLGGLVPFMGSVEGSAVTGLFIAYQFKECEPVINKLGDIAEFVTGYFIGSVLKNI
jgi:hypothetical protein